MVERAGSKPFTPVTTYTVAESGPLPAASSNAPPKQVPSIGSDDVTVERAQTGSLAMRDGENYAQCVLRFRKEGEQTYRWDASVAGCATGLLTGATAGLAIGGAFAAKSGGAGASSIPTLVIGGALVGCGLGAYGKYQEAGPVGAAAGEADGRLACDGLQGSPSNPAQPAMASKTSAATPPSSAGAAPSAPPGATVPPALSAAPPRSSATTAVPAPPAASAPAPQAGARLASGCIEDEASALSVCR
jgi:hypothetical protein